MSTKLLIMVGLAVTFGGVSYVAGNSYLENQTQARLSEIENSRETVQEFNLAKLVVAKVELKFGGTIKSEHLKIVDWPKDSLPEGGYASFAKIIADPNRRAITTIMPGEPVIASKITGENGRAGLAGLISEGKRAVTIPVDTVKGVGGFVQPGDHVDIVLTRDVYGGEVGPDSFNTSRKSISTARIMLENVKVLSVDQEAGQRTSSAHIAQSVTLETDTKGAQRIALALNVGRLSLLLRSVGDTTSGDTSQLSSDNMEGKEKGGFLSFLDSEPTTRAVRVVAGKEIEDYTVKIEN